LQIAEAVRNGDPVARVPLPTLYSAMVPESPLVGHWLEQLQTDISVIKVELRDEDAQSYSEKYLEQQGRRLLELGRPMVHQRAGGENLHAALDAYSRWIAGKYVHVDKRPTVWGGTQGRLLAFVRRHLPDCVLGELTSRRVEELIDILRLRPAGENGEPVSVSWTQSFIKQFRRFLRWLNGRPEFGWRRPFDLELARVQIPRTAAERAARFRSSQVATYREEELQTLWQNANRFQRLLMLLGLNCGFGRAEIASLELNEVFLHQRHPHAYDLGYRSVARRAGFSVFARRREFTANTSCGRRRCKRSNGGWGNVRPSTSIRTSLRCS